MTLSDLSIRRPVFAIVLSLMLIVVGLVSLSRLWQSVRELPDINPPIVSIDTNYRGASAQIIETKITQMIEERVGEQLALAGQRFGTPVVLRDRVRARLGRHDVREQCSSRHAVGDRVVDLHEDGHPSIVEAVEHVHPPQRSTAIERHARDVADRLVELRAVAWRREQDAPDVVVEVEVGILDPHGMVEAERDIDDATAEGWDQDEPRPDRVAQLDERQAVAGWTVEHGDLQRVHVERRGLHVEEPCVETTQTLHAGEYRAALGAELPSET